MKVDGAVMVEDPRDAGPASVSLENQGYDGAFIFEGRHDPFLPICVMAERSERIELITAIAVAFARNPMTLANLGYDLQLHSKGLRYPDVDCRTRYHDNPQEKMNCCWQGCKLRLKGWKHRRRGPGNNQKAWH